MIGQSYTMKLLLFFCIASSAVAFTTFHGSRPRVIRPPGWLFAESIETETETVTVTTTEMESEISPKEAVKLFGRLAEKYIVLDSSGGMCCYSACTDCEYRLPGGGYRMADQSAARPKWIPAYERRVAGAGNEHNTKWSVQIFAQSPVVNQDEFVTAVHSLEYVPPLGGPYVSASAAYLEDTTAAKRLFHILADGKDKLTKHRMGVRLKQLAGGEEGLTWPNFVSKCT